MPLTEQQKQYQKEYYNKHKEKRLALNKERRLANKETYKRRDKRYYEEHRDQILEQKKEYLKANRPKILEKMKAHYQVNRDIRLEQAKQNYQQNKIHKVAYSKRRRSEIRKEWIDIIAQKGMDKCCKCGYSDCFAAIDFHHINPEEKMFNISPKLRYRPNQKTLDEMDKCISLCSNCHRELHFKGEI